jgi:hypothetical protein
MQLRDFFHPVGTIDVLRTAFLAMPAGNAGVRLFLRFQQPIFHFEKKLRHRMLFGKHTLIVVVDGQIFRNLDA